MSSSSQIRSCTTSSAAPSIVASNVSSPSKFAIDTTSVAIGGKRKPMNFLSPQMKCNDTLNLGASSSHNTKFRPFYVLSISVQHNSLEWREIEREVLSQTWQLPPVALAMRFRSAFLHLRTAMAPFSTKYLRHRSSMPPVVRTTFAPAAKIFSIRSFVMSDSLQKTQYRRQVIARLWHISCCCWFLCANFQCWQ